MIVNGAQRGRSGFATASDPNLVPVLYDPSRPLNQRFTVLGGTNIARMYHSEATLLPDGSVLISGSDPQDSRYPQEYRVERFVPPYLSSGLPRPQYTIMHKDWSYGGTYVVVVTSGSLTNLRISLIGGKRLASSDTSHTAYLDYYSLI